MKWTPGPWKAFETEDGESRVNPAEGGMLVARCDVRFPFADEQMANARLIAAAPELYEALARLVKNISPYIAQDEQDGVLEAAIARADYALMKARAQA